MSDRPETLADICARIRTINESMMRDLDFMAVFLKFLPRDIEAAAKRRCATLEDALSHCREYAKKIERENEEGETRLDAEEIIATVDNEFAGIRPEHAPGNAAAMRDALEKFLDLARRGLAFFTSYRYTEAENDEIEAAFDEAKSALSAPARNCDRYATVRLVPTDGAGETPTGKGVGR